MSRDRTPGTKPGYALPFLAAAVLCSVPFAVTTASADQSKGPPQCATLASVLLKNKDISKAASAIQPAANGIASYCQVNITVSDLEGPKDGYLPGQKQMNMIGIALPLNSADGGGGGVQGNWNGRIEDVGGGGFNGSVGIAPYAPVTNSGYVGSSTDTGHESTVGTSDGSFAL